MKRIVKLILLSLILVASENSSGCTSAIVGAELNPSGRPILWKHRDTSTIDNKVEYVAPSQDGFGYVALFNAADKDLKEAWMGMNDIGFAVMNTASYNIKDDNVPEKKMDKEGLVMTRALRTCRTVDDFARLLETLQRPMGVEANFGVIDATGAGAYFETNNHSYVRYDLKDAEDHILVRTNYSHSGRPNEGYGFIREANANCLLKPYVDRKEVTPEVLTEEVSRKFYHDGLGKDLTMSENHKVKDEDFIPRYKSTATIAIEGCVPVSNMLKVTPDFVADEYIMWTGLGYPPVAEIRAVRCEEDGVDEDLRGTRSNGHSRLGDEAKRKRDEVFKVTKKAKYIDLSKLYSSDGEGYAQQAIRKNQETYRANSRKHSNESAE